MKKSYFTIALVLAVVVISVLAFAQPRGFGGPKMGAERMHRGPQDRSMVGIILRLEEKLDLTDEQVEQLKTIEEQAIDEHQETAEAVKAKQQALREAVKSNADESTIRTAATEIGTAIGNQAVLRVETKAKVDAVLTDAQKAKLEELKDEHKQRRQERQSQPRHKRGDFDKIRRRLGKSQDPVTVFGRIDADEDGLISLEEFADHMENMKHRFNNRPRGGSCPEAEEN